MNGNSLTNSSTSLRSSRGASPLPITHPTAPTITEWSGPGARYTTPPSSKHPSRSNVQVFERAVKSYV